MITALNSNRRTNKNSEWDSFTLAQLQLEEKLHSQAKAAKKSELKATGDFLNKQMEQRNQIQSRYKSQNRIEETEALEKNKSEIAILAQKKVEQRQKQEQMYRQTYNQWTKQHELDIYAQKQSKIEDLSKVKQTVMQQTKAEMNQVNHRRSTTQQISNVNKEKMKQDLMTRTNTYWDQISGPTSIFDGSSFAQNYDKQIQKLKKAQIRAKSIAERDSQLIQKQQETKTKLQELILNQSDQVQARNEIARDMATVRRKQGALEMLVQAKAVKQQEQNKIKNEKLADKMYMTEIHQKNRQIDSFEMQTQQQMRTQYRQGLDQQVKNFRSTIQNNIGVMPSNEKNLNSYELLHIQDAINEPSAYKIKSSPLLVPIIVQPAKPKVDQLQQIVLKQRNKLSQDQSPSSMLLLASNVSQLLSLKKIPQKYPSPIKECLVSVEQHY